MDDCINFSQSDWGKSLNKILKEPTSFQQVEYKNLGKLCNYLVEFLIQKRNMTGTSFKIEKSKAASHLAHCTLNSIIHCRLLIYPATDQGSFRVGWIGV